MEKNLFRTDIVIPNSPLVFVVKRKRREVEQEEKVQFVIVTGLFSAKVGNSSPVDVAKGDKRDFARYVRQIGGHVS